MAKNKQFYVPTGMLRLTIRPVGWVKEQSDVPIKSSTPHLTGTLRFTHPTNKSLTL